MNIIKSPQDNISAYLYNAVNIEIFEEYERCKYKGRKEPLDFFNVLFCEFNFFNENIENYLTIKSHFKDYDSKLDYYKVKNDDVLSSNLMDHYEALVKLIKEKYPFNLREGVILKSCEYIESISNVLTTMKHGNEDQMDYILKEIESLDYYEKIETLLQNKYISLRDESLFIDKRGITIASKIDIEIERLDKLRQLKLEIRPEPESIFEFDLSDSTGVQKIIYLHELGIIEFLRTKTKAGISNGGLASVLSGITGLKPGTIKSSLNRISNGDTADHRHPYNTKETVKKVKKNLNDLGF